MRSIINPRLPLLVAVGLLAVISFSVVSDGTTLNDDGGDAGWLHGTTKGSALPSTPVPLNQTTGYLNYSTSFTAYQKYRISLAVPAGFDFDLYLYTQAGALLASSQARDTTGLNETVTYQNKGLTATFTVQVQFYNGTGTGWFNLSATAIPNTSTPTLSDPGTSANNSIIFQAYTFVVTYADPDGYEPDFVNLELDGKTYPMERNESTGTDYMSGVQFIRQFPKLEAGTHVYYFNASDFSEAVTSGSYTLKVNKPASVAVNATSPYLQPFNAGYNVTWTATATGSQWVAATDDFVASGSSAYIADTTFNNPSAGTLASPLFDLTTAGTSMLQVIFGYRCLWIPKLPVVFSTLQVRVNMSAAWVQTPLYTMTNGIDQWQRVQLNVTSYKGSFVQFMFNFTGIYLDHLYVDEFQVKTYSIGGASFVASSSSPHLDPTSGNGYTTFTARLRYHEDNGNYPDEIYLYVCSGPSVTPFLTYVRRYAFLEANTTDWSISDGDGKEYYCQFQLYDVVNPRLYAWATGISLVFQMPAFSNGYLSFSYYGFTPAIAAVATTTMPFSLDFSAGSTTVYYVLDDPSFGSPGVINPGGNVQFSTGITTGNFADASTFQILGLATPYVAIASPVNVFLEFDSTITGVGIFMVNITADSGATWTTLVELDGGSPGSQAIDISAYKGATVSIRFVLETGIALSFPLAQWTIDNINIRSVDLTPPTMSGLSISDGQWLFGKLDVEMTVMDVGSGVQHVDVLVDGSTLVTITSIAADGKAKFNLDTMRFDNGDHNITIIVVDGNGNQNTYEIVVHIDNTPYWLLVVIPAAAVVIGIIAYRKLRKSGPAIKRKLHHLAIPPADVAKKILEVTAIFRRTTTADLAKKLAIKDLTAGKIHAYLNYMVSEGMIKGDLEGDVFTRVMAGKAKASLATKETAILEFLHGHKRSTLTEMVTELHLEGIPKDMIEDLVMGMVVAGKVSCYFEGDKIYCEDEAAAKVKEEIPEEPSVTSGTADVLAIRAARREAIMKRPSENAPITPGGESPMDKAASVPTQNEASIDPGSKPAGKPSEKAPWTILDKKDDIVRLVSSKDRVSFAEIKKEFALKESDEDIEDFLFDLIKGRSIKGIIEDGGFSRRE